MKFLVPAATTAMLLLFPLAATAQDAAPAAPPPASAAPAPAALAVAPAPAAPAEALAAAPAANQLKPGELDSLVAPIALYPDPLLSLVLMASTYPLEVVEAQRWLAANSKLKGPQLKAAATKQGWDESVSSLTATPTVLNMMNTQLQWTKKLGDAVLAQQADVMDAIQRLRSKAHANKKLNSTRQQSVSVSQSGGRDYIAIEPVDPNLIYVPYYEPAVVYGDWLYPDYPPYYFAAPGFIAADWLAAGIAFGVGYGIGYWAGGGYWWGGGCNWNNRNLYSNRPNNPNRHGNHWEHRPDHRRGVNNANNRGGKDQFNFRGRDGRQVVRPGDRARTGDRVNAGRDRAGNGQAGNRTRDARGTRSGQRVGQGNSNRFSQGGGRGRVGTSGAQFRSGPGRGRHRAFHGSGEFRSFHGGGNFRSFGSGGAGGGNVRSFGGGGGGGVRSFGGGGGVRSFGGGGGFHGGGGGGGFRGGGGGGGRRSDVRLKHDLVLIDRHESGLGIYRFRYYGDPQAYVGVMAQDAQLVRPDVVSRGSDGYLRVNYERLGLRFETYDAWAHDHGSAGRLGLRLH